jgi:UDPglucose 6-dehydrogenase
MKVTVIGVGYVGLITGVCLASIGHEVVCIDNDAEKIKMLARGETPIYEKQLAELLHTQQTRRNIIFTNKKEVAYEQPEIIIIAVGTPEDNNGAANMQYFESALADVIQNVNNDVLLMIKSTVPIGTGDNTAALVKKEIKSNINISVVSNPEFLSQGTAINDMLFGDRIIVGLDEQGKNYLREKNIISTLYSKFFQKIIFVNRIEAELIKYVANSFLSTKISFINEIANFSELVGANIDNIVSGIGEDKRIGKEFFQAGIGFGGSCFPKDLNAIINFGEKEYNYKFEILNAVLKVNNKQKIRLYDVSKSIFKDFYNKNIAILGLSYKANTNDTRESAAYKNIDLLLEEGANITVYDPYAIDQVKIKYAERLTYNNCIEDTINGVDMVFIFADWDEIKTFPVEKYRLLMNKPYIFDGRGCYDLTIMSNHLIRYFSIGRTKLKEAF